MACVLVVSAELSYLFFLTGLKSERIDHVVMSLRKKALHGTLDWRERVEVDGPKKVLMGNHFV